MVCDQKLHGGVEFGTTGVRSDQNYLTWFAPCSCDLENDVQGSGDLSHWRNQVVAFTTATVQEGCSGSAWRDNEDGGAVPRKICRRRW